MHSRSLSIDRPLVNSSKWVKPLKPLSSSQKKAQGIDTSYSGSAGSTAPQLPVCNRLSFGRTKPGAYTHCCKSCRNGHGHTPVCDTHNPPMGPSGGSAAAGPSGGNPAASGSGGSSAASGGFLNWISGVGAAATAAIKKALS